jgi:DNA primase
VLHQEINDRQVKLIRSLGKEVIVVPDQDAAGLNLVDRAVELGWSVSMPDWQGCKDINDAVIKYGQLATLISILESRESSRVKIELRKRQIAKKF